ncbi:MAG: hypothetical protein PHN69_03605 [Candidatus Pacebacteria bacterium]|nr:hypothetical protein [Fermentimonas sp.]MDD4804236.1 hypothetical protein [Candidatus Paceibacterota bacterium]
MTVTKLVAGDGTGDFNCDGSDDQEGINKALSWAASNPGNIIHLVGPYVFQVEDQVQIGPKTILSGDSNAVLKIPNMGCGTTASNCVFPDGKGVIASIPGTVPNEIEITGFEIDGNCQNQALKLGLAHGQPSSSGSGVERLISLGDLQGKTRANNIKIHNMYFHDAFGEAARIAFADNVLIYNNIASNHQHDAFFCIEVSGKNELRNNIIYGITDGCARFDNCSYWTVYENQFLAYAGTNNNTAYMYGHNGMQIGDESNKPSLTDNIEIFNNKFKGPNLCGIWLNTTTKAGATPQRVRIHHNTFTDDIAWRDNAGWSVGVNVGPWGNGVKIDHNTFDSCYNNAVQFNSAIVSGITAEVSYNNILNTKGSRTSLTGGPSVAGYGIVNLVSSNLTVLAEGNYMAGNKTGDYYKVTPGSTSLELIPDAKIIVDNSDTNYEVIVKCLESEAEGFVNKLTQNYNIYKKV